VVLQIKNLIKEHISLFVLGIASVSFFVLNIVLKDILSPEEYGLYSMLITYCSLMSAFGLFGLDQVFLRTSLIEDKEIIVDSRLISMLLIMVLFMSIIGSTVISKFYDFGIGYFYLILLSCSMALIKLSYNISRLLSKFFLSQLTLNFWKLGLTLLILFGLFVNLNITVSSISLYLFYFSLISLFSFIFFISKISFKVLSYSRADLMKLALGFFLTLFTLSILRFADRFIIERKFGLEEIGNYFFYVNLFLYPFTFFSSYIGFKELVTFKKVFSMDMLNKKIVLATKLAILFGVIYLLIILAIDSLNIYEFNLYDYKLVILLLMLWGIVKVVASLLSSGIGALTSQQDLNKINLLSIVLILSLGLTLHYCHTITSIIIFFLIVWVIRYGLYYLILYKKNIKK